MRLPQSKCRILLFLQLNISSTIYRNGISDFSLRRSRSPSHSRATTHLTKKKRRKMHHLISVLFLNKDYLLCGRPKLRFKNTQREMINHTSRASKTPRLKKKRKSWSRRSASSTSSVTTYLHDLTKESSSM